MLISPSSAPRRARMFACETNGDGEWRCEPLTHSCPAMQCDANELRPQIDNEERRGVIPMYVGIKYNFIEADHLF